MLSLSNSRTRRQLVALLGVALCALAFAACGDSERKDSATKAPTADSVYVGQIHGVKRAMVGIHVGSADATGARTVRAYACDGKSISAGGFALWFKGDLASNGETTLTAVGSGETLKVTVGATARGSVTFADGTPKPFDAAIAEEGSGIYDVTVGEDGSYKGNSSVGDVLDGTLKPGPPQSFSGSVKLKDGTLVKLNEATADSPIVPGTFTAVAWYFEGTHRLYMSGRSGDVRAGRPGLNIIDLNSWE